MVLHFWVPFLFDRAKSFPVYHAETYQYHISGRVSQRTNSVKFVTSICVPKIDFYWFWFYLDFSLKYCENLLNSDFSWKIVFNKKKNRKFLCNKFEIFSQIILNVKNLYLIRSFSIIWQTDSKTSVFKELVSPTTTHLISSIRLSHLNCSEKVKNTTSFFSWH